MSKRKKIKYFMVKKNLDFIRMFTMKLKERRKSESITRYAYFIKREIFKCAQVNEISDINPSVTMC